MAKSVSLTSALETPGYPAARVGPEQPRRTGRHRKPPSAAALWLQVPLLILVAGFITVGVQLFIARAYLIQSGSMEHTLHGCPGCVDDRVLVDKITYSLSTPQPGDVVVFKSPPHWVDNEYTPPPPGNLASRTMRRLGSLVGVVPPDEQDFVKRVIAVGGQTVSCCDAQNRVTVDGKPINETYLYWQPGRGTSQQDFPPVTVPQGDLWVMGDNRNNSDDSRTQAGGGINGMVPVNNVIGKVRAVIWPLSRWRGVGDGDPQAVAMNAPTWLGGVPTGVGAAAVLPTWYVGRRLRDRIGTRSTRQGRQ